MGGPSSLNVGLPVLSNPRAFARSIVPKAGGVRGSTLLQEAVLEEAGLRRLAQLLEAVREGRYVRAQDLTRAERVIARLAARDWLIIKRAMAFAQWQDSRFRQDPFRKFEPKAVEVILLPPVATVQAVQLSAGGAISTTASRGRREKLAAGEVGIEGAHRVGGISGPVVGYIGRVDDEERLVGPGRQGILSDFLGRQGVPGNTSLEIALKILENPQQSLALKVIAIRVLGDNIESLNRLETFLRTLEVIVAQFKSGVDPRLKEMALAFLKQVDLAVRPGLLEFFDQAIIQIGGGAHSLASPKPYLPGNREPYTGDDLRPYQERIVSLYAWLKANYPAELPTPSNFELGEGTAKSSAWHSVYPPWYSILPKVLGISGSGEEPAQQARSIFMDMHGHELWQQALALLYYSFLIHPSQGLFLSRNEANQATRDLLQLMREGLFPEMALAVYSHVIYNQVNAPFAQEDPHRDQGMENLWVSFKTIELAMVVGEQHPEVIRLRNLVNHLERRERAVQAQNNPPSAPSFWQRAATALRRFFD